MPYQIKTGQSLHKILIFIILLLGSSLVLFTTVGAISKGYKTNDPGLQPGMVVSLSNGDNEESSIVVRAEEQNQERIVGVATTIEESSITLASSGQTVFIQNDGEVKAYVSDLIGLVKKGDQLTLSPLKGILAVSTNESKIHLGTATEDFPASGYENYEILTENGKKTVNIAQVKINLDTKNLTNAAKPDSTLERLGKAVTGKDISEIRVIVALVIFFIVLFAEGGILYGAISSAFTSLGRNPMAKKTIKKELFQIILVAIVVLIIGLGAIYLVLRI